MPSRRNDNGENKFISIMLAILVAWLTLMPFAASFETVAASFFLWLLMLSIIGRHLF